MPERQARRLEQACFRGPLLQLELEPLALAFPLAQPPELPVPILLSLVALRAPPGQELLGPEQARA